MSCVFSVSLTASTPPSILYGFVRDVPRMVPPLGRMPRQCSMLSGQREVLGQALPAVTESDEGVAVLDFAFADHGPDNGIEPRAVATAGQHSDSHHTLLAIDGAETLSRAAPARSSRPPVEHGDDASMWDQLLERLGRPVVAAALARTAARRSSNVAKRSIQKTCSLSACPPAVARAGNAGVRMIGVASSTRRRPGPTRTSSRPASDREGVRQPDDLSESVVLRGNEREGCG